MTMKKKPYMKPFMLGISKDFISQKLMHYDALLIEPIFYEKKNLKKNTSEFINKLKIVILCVKRICGLYDPLRSILFSKFHYDFEILHCHMVKKKNKKLSPCP